MIKIGTFLQLEEISKNYNNDNVQDMKVTFRCRVIETAEEELIIDLPINELTDKTAFFTEGVALKVSYIQNNSVFVFPSKVIGKRIDNIPGIILSYDKDRVKKVQRREFVRVDSLLDISIRSPYDNFSPVTGVTRDISGGGLSVYMDNNLEFNEEESLDIMLVLPMENTLEYLHLQGSVVRFQKEETKGILSVKFNDISIQNQQKIIKFCYLEQLRIKRKEMK
ncbi:c-di-GMP-binding flagellar brake protein YcgR, contains PilZNR and PilZ domains [Gracilibacillus ureilyticus]|uniref:C-di-GMP-binding flagellar brake protein YcgR, contains PilZNR and PilZ domains n=1 Tax=Gracilibacillus ureilyticus TaxID=531814 RepID=A0A1H9LQM1_9BACI|nr:PilZ domain-containing protein [Gracilibacillus ureilyticus]SER13802.1 c-di-GMP-binding flagellar brake protein YcgR, contains PilZNR and PilZ domains [Gracilibacillus ureilyticus]